MPSGSRSLSEQSAFHHALIAFVCVVMVLLSGSSPTGLAGTDWPTRQIDDRIEQIEALNLAAVPMLRLDTRFSEHLLDNPVEHDGRTHDKLVESNEPTDDDETKNYVLLRSYVTALRSQTGLYEPLAERALTPFRLLAFSTRGSPSA